MKGNAESGILQDKAFLLSRFEKELMEELEWLASFGGDETGGVTRLLYTNTWQQAQLALKNKLDDGGFRTGFDAVGNLFATLQGTNKETPPILTGSHIDTVVHGGKYDGSYGIIASMLALRYLKERYGTPKISLAFVSLCEEEGSRFPMAYLGSGSITGQKDAASMLALKDEKGVTLGKAMSDCGFGITKGSDDDGKDSFKDLQRKFSYFIEAHIEQGAVLEREDIAIGLVETIAGQRRWKFEVTGEANHAGTTPMYMRRDALAGTSLMISALRQEALRRGAPLVATVGRLDVKPNVPNVVPGYVSFTVDMRHTDDVLLDAFCSWVSAGFQAIADECGLELTGSEWMRESASPMDEKLVGALEGICAGYGIASRRMMSGAGHDAQMLGRICPAVMIFVPSVSGISHSPLEYTKPADLAAGTLILSELLYKLGYEEGEYNDESL
jgi:allantoate deiminase